MRGRHDAEDCLTAAGEFARRWPSTGASERSAWLSFRAGDYDRSIVAYRRATEQDPRSIKAWNGLGVCALNSWLLSDRLDGTAREEARHAFERSLEVESAQPQVEKLLQDGRTEALSGFVSKAGKNFTAHLVLGQRGKVEFEFPDR